MKVHGPRPSGLGLRSLLHVSRFDLSHANTGGWCGAVVESRRGASAASCAALGDCSGDRVERPICCVPVPLTGREAASQRCDTEHSAY